METKTKSEEKKEMVLRAAAEVFARFGYDKTTLDDIGKRAGLNKASLYYYYKNKEDIFVAVVLSETRAFMTDLQGKTLAYPDIRKQIRYFLTERIRRYGEVLHLGRLSVDNLHRLEPVLEELSQQTKATEVSFLVSLLRKASADQALAINLPSAVLSDHLFYLSDALKHGIVHQAITLEAGEIDFSPAIEQMEFWLKTILR
ncbi:MAG: TetR/AcrR family transcriptional regulator [Saprospiraceae bacterium]